MRVAVVLGAAVWPGGNPSPALRRRTLHAVGLWRQGRVDAVLGCGGLGAHPPAEAEVIATICRHAGLPDTAIGSEDQSRTTRENLTLALPILRRMGAREVVIVTDAYHAARARMLARQLGLRATTASPPPGPVRFRVRARRRLREGAAMLAVLLRLR